MYYILFFPAKIIYSIRKNQRQGKALTAGAFSAPRKTMEDTEFRGSASLL
jgi:hypothetical protein